MKKITTILLFTLFFGLCKAQSGATTSTTKTMTMTFEEYSEGDYPHLIFKDVKTGIEYDFRFISDNKLGNLNILLDDADASFGSKANPKYLKKKFTVVAIKKIVLDSDLEGNTIKTKAWVISKISLINTTQTNATTTKLPFVGKRWYSMENALANGTGYDVSNYIEIKTDGSVYFGNNIVTKGNENFAHRIYAGKFKNIISCYNKENDEFSACNGFYKITSDMIYSVDAKGNILNDFMCCKGDFPVETRKCNCKSKLRTNQYEYEDQEVNNSTQQSDISSYSSNFQNCGTVTDIDGNVYNTVMIGTQCWMVENLKTTHYNDGTAIPNVTNNTTWANLTKGAWCYYNNDANNNATYGKLYNWYTVNTGKLAPAGWHVPTNNEWVTLIDFLGGLSEAGNKMKASTLWTLENGIINTNSSGFTGLPAGYRVGSGINSFGTINYRGNFWSSSLNSNSGLGFNIIHNNSDANGVYSYFRSGYSVRCIKD